jgi:hypothetical protein
MHRTRLSQTFGLAVVLFLLTVAPSAAFFETSWQDTLDASRTWHRPTANQQEVAGGAATPFSVQSLYVDRSGLFQIDADDAESGLPFDGYVFLYAGSFDPAQPLRNLIAGNEAGPDGTSMAHIAAVLTAGAIYHVVTTADDAGLGRFRDDVVGPGAIHFSGCAAHGNVPASDDNSLSLVAGRFCVSATWKDESGATHVAVPVQFRSDSSALFWFLDPANWEIQVKLVDACKINSHFWVMASGTTHLDFQVQVDDTWDQSSTTRRVYRHRQGDTRASLDNLAFDGCPPAAASRHR